MIRLRIFKPGDAGRILSWIRDEETYLLWGGERFGPFPVTAEVMNRKYMDENGDCAEEDNFYPVTAMDEMGIVGHFIIRYLGGDPRILRFGWVIVDDSRRGSGIGREMLTLGLKAAFEIMGAEKVTIGVFEQNLPALRCYRSAGFRIAEGKEHTETVGEEPMKVLELELGREEYLRRPEGLRP